MKKLLVLTLALVLTLSFGYATLASTMGIGSSEGAVSVEVGKVVDPSGSDNIDLSVYYGLNDQTLLSLGYGTDDKYILLGARYAFSENLAATFGYLMPDDENADDEITTGLRYKTKVSDALALVGALEYTNTDPDATIVIKAQGEYSFSDKIVGTLQYKYKEVTDNTSNIIVGIETYPTEKLCVYLDFDMPEEEEKEDSAYLGISYSF